MEEWGVVYHYTSLDAFVNIIKTKKFRLSDITKSNDPLEGVFVLKALKERCDLCCFLDNGLSEKQYWAARKAFFCFEETVSHRGKLSDFIAAASFCVPNRDLMMLRSYADNGKGVAIGVSTESLKKFAEMHQGIEFQKVKYLSWDEIKQYAMEFWKEVVSGIEVCREDLNDEILNPIVEKIHSEYKKGFFIKNDVNKDEEEYRLLYYKNDLFNLHLPKISVEIPAEINFVSMGNDIKAYYEIPVGEGDSLSFDSIVMGPNCKATDSEMQVFLQRNGFFLNSIQNNSWVEMR